MRRIIDSEKLPIKLWLDDLEAGALKQARHLANLPFAVGHVALMPDSHQGFGMPIGGVLATRDVIIPNAVGVDIGCGMCAVRTSLERLERPALAAVIGHIVRRVPVGFAWHDRPQADGLMPDGLSPVETPVVWEQYERARRQLGTLGGGNHFIELQQGSDGRVWLMVHSGSRNLGKQVADRYNRLAVALNEKWRSPVPRAWQLAYLPLETPEAARYRREMEYCVEFALANRLQMMARIREAVADVAGAVEFDHPVNIAHNFAAGERHFGQDVVVHRKGATQARAGQLGIVPGSQGTRSYLVRGRGNPESFESCSHGAGRRMGRQEARRRLDLAEQQARLDARGILHSLRSRRDLDEAPDAYKDIDAVMANQADLVDIAVELTPLAVVKGGDEGG